MRIQFLIVIFALFSIALPANVAAEPPSAAVLDLRGGKGVDAKTVETFSSIIRNEAQQLEKYKVVNKLPINFNDILMALGCSEATETCLIQAAEQVNAKVLIYGSIDKSADDGLKVIVTIFDAGNKRTLNKLTRTIASTDDPVISFRREVASFFAAQGDTAVTRLQIGSNVTGAKISMEDTFVGTAPYERKGLPPGTYKIVVTADKHAEFATSVTLTEGEDISLWAELTPMAAVAEENNNTETFEQPNPNLKRITDPPPTKSINWTALAVAGGGVALIGASLIVGGMVKGTENELSDLRDRGELTRTRFDELKRRGESQQLIHFILLGSGIGIATGGLVWFALAPVERDRVSIQVSPTQVNATIRF